MHVRGGQHLEFSVTESRNQVMLDGVLVPHIGLWLDVRLNRLQPGFKKRSDGHPVRVDRGSGSAFGQPHRFLLFGLTLCAERRGTPVPLAISPDPADRPGHATGPALVDGHILVLLLMTLLIEICPLGIIMSSIWRMMCTLFVRSSADARGVPTRGGPSPCPVVVIPRSALDVWLNDDQLVAAIISGPQPVSGWC